MNVSVLVLTLDEEKSLPRCLDSIAWCDDVVVLDSGSTDHTLDIARERGARVLERPFDSFASQRNWGLETGELRHPWVLHLDADEVVPGDLRKEMEEKLPSAGEDAFRLPSKMIFQGRWLKHAGLHPSYQVRLGRRDRLRFTQVGHGQREVPGLKVGTFDAALEHHSFDKGLQHWFEKHNRYSTDEALHELGGSGIEWAEGEAGDLADPVGRRRWLKRVARRLPFRPTLRFLYMYLLRGGFLDGRAGYDYCRMLSLYEAMTVLKVREFRARAWDDRAD